MLLDGDLATCGTISSLSVITGAWTMLGGISLIGHVVGLLYQKYGVGRQEIPEHSAVLITGCSSGIGKDAAVFLANKGWHVFAVVRNPADGEILPKIARKIIPICFDITKKEEVKGGVAKVKQILEKESLSLVAVINNAGYPLCGVMELVQVSDLLKQFEVNVGGQVQVSQNFLPLLRAHGHPSFSPRLIFISSWMGKLTLPGFGAHAASKHAIEAISDAFRMELMPWGIDVITIEPGATRTNFNAVAKKTLGMTMNKSLGTELLKPYLKVTNSLARQEAILERVSSTTDATNEVIDFALRDIRPLARYRSGFDSKFGLWVAALLPDRLKDLVLAAGFRELV